MDLSNIKILLLLNWWLFSEAAPTLQQATSSQSFVIHQPQVSPSSSNLISGPSSIGKPGGSNLNQPKYEYKYEVSDHHTGDRKSHWETREGDKVRGVYTLYEPDGALRRVEYSADAINGFNAIVTRDGKTNHHPPQEPAYNYGGSSRSDEGYGPSSRAYIPDRNTGTSGYGGDRTRPYLGSNTVDNTGGVGFSVNHSPLKAGDIGSTPY